MFTKGYGSFGVLAGDVHEALDIAKGMVERGIEEVEILNEDGVALSARPSARIRTPQDANAERLAPGHATRVVF